MAQLNVPCKVSGVTIKYILELWFLIGPEDG